MPPGPAAAGPHSASVQLMPISILDSSQRKSSLPEKAFVPGGQGSLLPPLAASAGGGRPENSGNVQKQLRFVYEPSDAAAHPPSEHAGVRISNFFLTTP